MFNFLHFFYICWGLLPHLLGGSSWHRNIGLEKYWEGKQYYKAESWVTIISLIFIMIWGKKISFPAFLLYLLGFNSTVGS